MSENGIEGYRPNSLFELNSTFLFLFLNAQTACFGVLNP